MRHHKLVRIYTPSSLKEGQMVNLDKDKSHYLITVMRRQQSDEILLFNAEDGEFVGKIVAASKNEVGVRLEKQTKIPYKTMQLALLYAPVKNAKNEFIVQKATEMGATVIQPVITERTIKDKTKPERLALVAIEAAEQCERLDVPVVNDITELDKALSKFSDHQIILCDETGKGNVVSKILPSLKSTNTSTDTKIAVLIGPEGGFSEAELKALHAMPNVSAIGMGPRILRAETAIITVLALVQAYLGDFDKLPDFRG